MTSLFQRHPIVWSVGLLLIGALISQGISCATYRSSAQKKAQLVPNWNIDLARGPDIYQQLAGSVVFLIQTATGTEATPSGYSLLVIENRTNFCSAFTVLPIQGANVHLGSFVGKAVLVKRFSAAERGATTTDSAPHTIWVEELTLDEAVNQKQEAYKKACAEPFKRFAHNLTLSSLEIPSAGPLQAITKDESYWIKRNGDASTLLRASGFDQGWHLPEGIAAPQFQQSYALTDETVFGMIRQRNLNTVLYNADGSFWEATSTFAGLIFSNDTGRTWKTSFDIFKIAPINAGRFNPVGMFFEKGRYYLDIANDHGAGSGEGALIRYWTVNGTTWQREGCYYFLPERYYDASYGQADSHIPYGQLPPIQGPHQLKAISCSSLL